MNILRALPSICAALAICGGAGVAHAQVDPDIQLGSKIPVRPKKSDPESDGTMRDNFSDCIYRLERPTIDGYLAASDPIAADFGTSGLDQSKLFQNRSLRGCFVNPGDTVRSSITFSGPALRYMMLEQAYLYSVRALPADYVMHAGEPRKYASSGAELATAQSLGKFSDCLATSDPVGADKLLRTPSGSKAELAAAKALVPALSACIVAGQQLELKAANIRAFAADGMWQRFVAKPQGSS